jgi:hypothetical protein
MRREGRHAGTTIWTWVACGLLLAAAVVAGRILAEPLSDDALSVVLGFAGEAVLASLADTVMPEAFDSGGLFVALATTAGFLISNILAERASWAPHAVGLPRLALKAGVLADASAPRSRDPRCMRAALPPLRNSHNTHGPMIDELPCAGRQEVGP